jgi:hypothetical protein
MSKARVTIVVTEDLAVQLCEHLCRVGITSDFATNFSGEQALVLDCNGPKLLAALETLPDGSLADLDWQASVLDRARAVLSERKKR